MVEIIIILVGFAIVFFLEAKHDYYIILNEQDLRQAETKPFKKQDQQLRTNGWHRINWFMYAILSVMAASILFSYYNVWLVFLILISIAALRILIFNTRLNLLRGLDWNYVGENGVEGKFKGKETLYYIIALISIIATTGFLIALIPI